MGSRACRATLVGGGQASELDRFEAFWHDEMAAAALYRALGGLDADRLQVLFHLAATEERHAAHWAALLASAERPPPSFRRPGRHRVLVGLGRWFGVTRVLPAVIRAEAADRDRYRASVHAAPEMAQEEAAHGRSLALTAGGSVGDALALADARHRTSAGGGVRRE